ncbi:hypothetical protein H7698_03405 [Pseudomonas sp. p50]|uniref:hypothetical protein n=1 Tax=Pseudomonas sp. p50(2008) TaxID=2816832 RepID=UPI00188BF1AB|nr:hypothetical protein [Pseudomonas sp. p50(2008)]MBF4555104.1 hypothetical protein [Pseudomonas sp. p50(2008)]
MINFILVFFANVFFSAPSIILVVATSHLGGFNDAAMLGAAFSICAPIQLFFSMQHNVSILSGKLSFKESLSTRVRLVVPFLLFGLLGSIVFSSQIVFWFFLYRCAEFLYEPVLCEGIRAGKYRSVFIASLLRCALFSVIVFSSLYFGADLHVALLIVGVVFSLLTLKFAYIAFNEAVPSWGGFVLGAAAFFSSVIVNIPRYFVVGADAPFAGFYSSMLTLVLGGGLLYGAFNNYFFPRFIASGNIGVMKFLNMSLVVFLGGMLLSYGLFSGTVFSKLFLATFLGDKYLVYFQFVMGFACFYFVMYFHAALNFIFVFLCLSKTYMVSLIAYGVCMAVFIFFGLEYYKAEYSHLIWMVVCFGVIYAGACYFFLRVKLVGGQCK